MLRDLTPERRKSRYGDIDFDFDHGVDTTWATVSLRTRVREWLSGGQYQPSEPTLFREIIESLPVPPDGFTFIDLGSGKGRTLLMASSFPFRRIIGMELLEELNAIAAAEHRALPQRRAALFRDRGPCGRRALLRLSRRAYRVVPVQSLSATHLARSIGEFAGVVGSRAARGFRHLSQSCSRGHLEGARMVARGEAHASVCDL